MAGLKFTSLPAGLSLANKKDLVTVGASPIATKYYERQFIIRLPIVASASAQAIAYTSIQGWPTKYARVMNTCINVITAESTGTTKTVSFGYAGSTTAFVNAQSVASETADSLIKAANASNELQYRDSTYDYKNVKLRKHTEYKTSMANQKAAEYGADLARKQSRTHYWDSASRGIGAAASIVTGKQIGRAHV